MTSTVEFDREGVHHGYLRVPYSHDRSAYGHIPIPLTVAGRGAGPTVLLTGGVHGDEYEGPIALMRLMRLMRDVPLDRLSGRIIIVPALNFPAYLSAARTSPIDRLNLNRRFPGDRNGLPTDMIAHYVETVLMPMADYCLDFHAGGASLRYLPTLLVERPATETQRRKLGTVVDAFCPPRLLYMDMLGEDRVIAAAALRHDVCFVTGEFGGGATVDLDGLDVLTKGLARVLRAVGVLDDGLEDGTEAATGRTRTLSVKGADHYLFAARPGIFEPTFQLGDEVVAGQLAGYIHDPHAPWQAPEEIRFAGSGLALCIRTQALVVPGDCLGHLASDEPRADAGVGP